MSSDSMKGPALLLEGVDVPPELEQNVAGRSPFLLTCDHYGRLVPRSLGDLGLPKSEWERHIAWDIGAGALAMLLGEALGACVARQPYCRLVVDCNRAPDHPDVAPAVSDGVTIPANASLTEEARAERLAAIHELYHARIDRLLDERAEAGRPTALLFLHSFTPVMNALERPWRFGVLHSGQRLALAVLDGLRAAGEGEVGDNQPYRMDETDYTAARHGAARGLDFVELEVRQDLIGHPAGQRRTASLLARVLSEALAAAGQA